MYINCKTYFSFRYGTFTTKELVHAAVEHGVTALALTNINNTCDSWEFIKLCRAAGIKPVAGVEVRVAAIEKLVVPLQEIENFRAVLYEIVGSVTLRYEGFF